MHELETAVALTEHLGYHVESLLEQAAEELNYREFLCMALQQEWNGRHQRSMDLAEIGPASRGSKRSAVRLRLQRLIVRSSVSWPGWRSWSVART